MNNAVHPYYIRYDGVGHLYIIPELLIEDFDSTFDDDVFKKFDEYRYDGNIATLKIFINPNELIDQNFLTNHFG